MAFLVISFSEACGKSSAQGFLEFLWASAWMRISISAPCRLQLCCYTLWSELEVTSCSFYSRHSVNIMPPVVYLWDFLISLLNNKDKPWSIFCLFRLSYAKLFGEMCGVWFFSFFPFTLGTVSFALLDPSHVCDPVLWTDLQMMCSENAFCVCNVEMSVTAQIMSAVHGIIILYCRDSRTNRCEYTHYFIFPALFPVFLVNPVVLCMQRIEILWVSTCVLAIVIFPLDWSLLFPFGV